MSEWISVDNPPKHAGEYLISDGQSIDLATYMFRAASWVLNKSKCEKITHWMPRPEPPETKE